ncbi:MAG: UDP-glucose 4-epimerase GalE [Bacteroidales bacterium]|nr:UDP-glucose 4-epimerase GalE [Bacteroidales bacterium]
MKKLVLVTGGTGYIGSHTAVELIKSGYQVLIADNLMNSRIEVLEGIREITGTRPYFEEFDLCDMQKLNACCRKYKNIEAIIHFAALKAVGESVSHPLEYYENNLVSMINLLKAMRDFQIPNLVFSSSCTVYGQPEVLPVTEEAPVQKAASPYGNTKQISEEMIADFLATDDGYRAISLRYFNPVGAHQSALIGEYPIGPPLNLIPIITQTLIGKRSELHVFGNDYDTPDGTGIRDYIYVVDLARAHVAAINRLTGQAGTEPFEVFNLGTGKGLSVLEIIRTFEKVLQRKVNYKISPRRPGDIGCIYADASKANKVLGWEATTPLEEVVLSSWHWEQQIKRKSIL